MPHTSASAVTRLSRAALAVGICGALARAYYVLYLHHPRHHVASDALNYLELAHEFVETPGKLSLQSTVWPPGAAALWALLLSLDPTLQLAAIVNVMCGICSVLLIGAAAYRLGGRELSCWAVILAALDPASIHYGGFFLAEAPFQLAVVLAFYLSLVALISMDVCCSREAARPSWPSAIAAGSAWGVASLFRPSALPVVLVGLLLVLAFWRWAAQVRRTATQFAAALLVGLALVSVPAAERCTRNSEGELCLLSHNAAMNFALGQAGAVPGLEFIAPDSDANGSAWRPPALARHSELPMGRVSATIFDTAGVLGWTFRRIAAAPLESLANALGNVFDLFQATLWPASYGAMAPRIATVMHQAYLLLVIAPGVLGLLRCLQAGWRKRAQPSALVFTLGASLGLCASAAMSLGEARYRVPFDFLFIIPASAIYARRDRSWLTLSHQSSSLPRTTPWLAACCVALAALVILTISDGRLGSLAWLARSETATGLSEVDIVEGKQMRLFKASGVPSSSPGTYHFECRPSCRELRVTFPSRVFSDSLSLSVEGDDRYRLRFYRAGRIVGQSELAADAWSGAGLRSLRVPVRTGVEGTGFDAVGVLPLYGDGSYALGHLTPLR